MQFILKNTFTYSIIFLTVLWSMGITALIPMVANAAECPTLLAGDLFKVPGNSAVYLLNSDMERLYFPHSSVYQTWYEDFSSVVEISNTCVDNYPSPSSPPYGVNYRPGSKLVKVTISPSVYVVETGNKKSKIGSEDIAIALYGNDWASKVVDVADVFWPNYSATGDELTSAMPHNGMLIKKADSADVYFIKDNARYLVEGELRGDVQTVSELSFDYVADAFEVVTKDSIYSDPTQISTMAVVEDLGDSQIIIEAKDDVVVEEDGVVRITSAIGESIRPSIAWDGANYGMVWADDRVGANTEIYFALFDKNGNKVVEDTQITDTPEFISTNPEIVWNGNDFAIVYSKYSVDVAINGGVNFVRINNAGSLIGGIVEIRSDSIELHPKIEWNGNGYGIIWRTPTNTNAKTYFSYLDLDGNILKNEIRVITAESSDQTEIIWDGSKFALIYRKSPEILAFGDTPTYSVGTYLYRIDENADSIRNELFITDKEVLTAVVVDSNYAIIEDSKTFSRFSLNSALFVENKEISSLGLSDPDMVLGGNKYGVVGQRDGLIRFLEINNDGTVNQADMQINDISNTSSSTPRINWSGSEYGVVWSDTQDNNSGAEIYFRSLDTK